MVYFILGLGTGVIISAIVNHWFKSGPSWIKTRTLFWIGTALIILSLIWGWQEGF